MAWQGVSWSQCSRLILLGLTEKEDDQSVLGHRVTVCLADWLALQ